MKLKWHQIKFRFDNVPTNSYIVNISMPNEGQVLPVKVCISALLRCQHNLFVAPLP